MEHIHREAESLKVDAVIGVKIFINEVSGGLVEVLAIGTGIKQEQCRRHADRQLLPQAIIRDRDTFFDQTHIGAANLPRRRRGRRRVWRPLPWTSQGSSGDKMPATKPIVGDWYDHPEIYDLSLRDETPLEAAFIEAACRKYCDFSVRRLWSRPAVRAGWWPKWLPAVTRLPGWT